MARKAFADDLEEARRGLSSGFIASHAGLEAAIHQEAIEAAPRCADCGRNVVEAGRGKGRNWAGYERDFATREDLNRGRPKYCSNACKQRAYRKRVTANDAVGVVRRNEDERGD